MKLIITRYGETEELKAGIFISRDEEDRLNRVGCALFEFGLDELIPMPEFERKSIYGKVEYFDWRYSRTSCRKMTRLDVVFEKLDKLIRVNPFLVR